MEYQKHKIQISNTDHSVLFRLPIVFLDTRELFLDVSRIIKPAITKDVNLGYNPENGPNFFIELRRAAEYVKYLQSCKVSSTNFSKYNTRRGYTLCYNNSNA